MASERGDGMGVSGRKWTREALIEERDAAIRAMAVARRERDDAVSEVQALRAADARSNHYRGAVHPYENSTTDSATTERWSFRECPLGELEEGCCGDFEDCARRLRGAALDTCEHSDHPKGAVDPSEEPLLRIVMRALSDARTQVNPHDPAVRSYWRDEIRAALATQRAAVRDAVRDGAATSAVPGDRREPLNHALPDPPIT